MPLTQKALPETPCVSIERVQSHSRGLVAAGHTCLFIYKNRQYICICGHIHTWIYLYKHIYKHVYIYTCIHVYMYIYTYIHICIYMNIDIYIYICIYIYIAIPSYQRRPSSLRKREGNVRFPTNLHVVLRSARPTFRWAPKAHRMMGKTEWRHCERSFGTNVLVFGKERDNFPLLSEPLKTDVNKNVITERLLN